MPEYKCPQLDNQHFADKIALRAAILGEAKFEEVNVLDLFAGAGHIWTEMGKKFKLTSYLPVDIKPRLPGTLKLDVCGFAQNMKLSTSLFQGLTALQPPYCESFRRHKLKFSPQNLRKR